ncbi:hypothetical protein ACFL6L_00465 [candidate division KSB1 bacterium]
MRISKQIPVIFIAVLLLIFSTIPAYGQYSYIKLTSFSYEGAPVRVIEPEVRGVNGEGFRIYCDIENISDADLTSIHLWVLIYFEDGSGPVLYDYTDVISLQPGIIQNFIWDEPQSQYGDPVSGLIAPFLCELSDGTYWSLKEYYALENQDISFLTTPLKFPEIGYITTLKDSIGVFKAFKNTDLQQGQRVGVVRQSEDAVEHIGQLGILKTTPTRYGFKTLQEYPGKTVAETDRVQLIFPGLTCLNSTTRSLWWISGLSAVATGFFEYEKNRAFDNLKKTTTAASYYRNKIKENKVRRDAAALNAGISLGGAVVSQLIWGRYGSHLYPPDMGDFSLQYCNTNTKSLLTIGALSFGSGLYHVYQKNSALDKARETDDLGRAYFFHDKAETYRFRRDASMILSASAIGAAFMNQSFSGNDWLYTGYSGTRLLPTNWSPISKSFLLMGINSGILGLTFQYTRQHANYISKNAYSRADQWKYSRVGLKQKKRRDIAYIVSGSAVTAALFHELFMRPDPDDIFTSRAYRALPRLPGPSKLFASLGAASLVASGYYQYRASDYHDRLIDNTDPENDENLRSKVNFYESRRSYALFSAGIMAGSTVLTYLAFRNQLDENKKGLGSTSTEKQSFSITPEINPLTNSIGLRIQF